VSPSGIQTLGFQQGNALVLASSNLYVLDNEPISFSQNGTTTTAPSQILPFTVGSNGSLQAQTGGIIPDDPTLANPIQLMLESKGKFLYVANQGNNTSGPNPNSGLAGYFLTSSPAFQATFIAGEPFGSGSGPQCIVEDPSNQYIYTANQYDSTVSGRLLDPNSGVLNQLRGSNTYSLPGPATWCFMDGRTN
jgi:DNA-binding beta-propeller fold protein YncE